MKIGDSLDQSARQKLGVSRPPRSRRRNSRFANSEPANQVLADLPGIEAWFRGRVINRDGMFAIVDVARKVKKAERADLDAKLVELIQSDGVIEKYRGPRYHG